jgi:hypothetical protein
MSRATTMGLLALVACRASEPHPTPAPTRVLTDAGPSDAARPDEQATCRGAPDTVAWDASDRLVLLCPGRHLALRLTKQGTAVEQELRVGGSLSKLGDLFLLESGADERQSQRIHALDTFATLASGPERSASSESGAVLSVAARSTMEFRVFEARSGAMISSVVVPYVEEPRSARYLAEPGVLAVRQHGVESPSRSWFYRLVGDKLREVEVGGEPAVVGPTFFVSVATTPSALVRLDLEGRETKRRAVRCEPGPLHVSPDGRSLVFGCGTTVRVVDATTLREERVCGEIPRRQEEGSAVPLTGTFIDDGHFQIDLGGERSEDLELATCLRTPSPARVRCGGRADLCTRRGASGQIAIHDRHGAVRGSLACDGALTLAPSGTRALCEATGSASVLALDGRVLYRVR